jgi:integrase
MAEMPKPRPPYLNRELNRHGVATWYFRKYPGPRIRIRGDFGSPEFFAAYNSALAGEAATPAPAGPSGSVSWLWDRYREATSWAALASSTRRARENIMAGVLAKIGAEPCGKVRAADIAASRDARAATPAQARAFLDAMRALFRWAVTAYPDQVRVDPTAAVASPKRRQGAGFAAWTESEIEAFETRWSVGTRPRVWFDVLLYTGLRRGDAVRLGRQHIRDDLATLKTEKSGGAVTVNLPILPVLAVTLAAGPCGDLAFICGERGQPLTKETFGNEFRKACNKAGVTGKSAHGLRKAGATRAADNGATVAELEAIFGWRGGNMAALYTRTADRKRASVRAMSKLEKRNV